MRHGRLLAEGPPDAVMKQHCATVSTLKSQQTVWVPRVAGSQGMEVVWLFFALHHFNMNKS